MSDAEERGKPGDAIGEAIEEVNQLFAKGSGTESRPTRAPTDAFERTLDRFREFELISLYQKVCQVPQRPKARPWTAAGGILVGAAIGALIAGIPLLNSSGEWDGWVKPVYAGAVVLAFLIAGMCFLCARHIRQERSTTMEEIKNDFRRLLEAYALNPDDHDPTANTS